MGRRAIAAAKPTSAYKYQDDPIGGTRAHELCEMTEPDGKHTVKPATWPPVALGRQNGEPFLRERCIHCGVNVLVYRKHATGQMDGITVILPETKVTARAAEPTPNRRGRRPQKPKEAEAEVA